MLYKIYSVAVLVMFIGANAKHFPWAWSDTVMRCGVLLVMVLLFIGIGRYLLTDSE